MIRGVLLAGLTVLVALWLPEDLVYPLFAVLLAFAAAVYVGAAMQDSSRGERRLQWLVALGFTAVGVLGLWLSPLFLVAGWVLHMIWDGLHHLEKLETRVAAGYALTCLVYDLMVGGFVLYWWLTH